jgi:hypothetical protein
MPSMTDFTASFGIAISRHGVTSGVFAPDRELVDRRKKLAGLVADRQMRAPPP